MLWNTLFLRVFLYFFFLWNSLIFSRNNFLNATVISEIVKGMAKRKGRNKLKLILPE